MSRYGGRERERDYGRPADRRRSVDVTFKERDYEERDSGPTYTRERDLRFDENFESFESRDVRTSQAMVPIHQERVIERDIITSPPPQQERFVEVERIERIEPVIEVEVEKKITEHEHEHHHHHIVIDHGTTYINAAPQPPPPPPAPKARTEIREREVTRVTLEGVRERRYGANYRGSGSLSMEREYIPEQPPRREREREQSRSRTVEYRKYSEPVRDKFVEEDVANFGQYTSPRQSSGMLMGHSPRSSVGGLGTFEETERITTGVRRSGGGTRPAFKQRERKGELWTEITKDLVAREALEEFGFYFEETDDFMYIFEYLSRDQITDLIELTKDIRREKVEAIERDSRSRSRAPGGDRGYHEHDRITERRDFTPYGERDRVTERRDIYYN